MKRPTHVIKIRFYKLRRDAYCTLTLSILYLFTYHVHIPVLKIKDFPLDKYITGELPAEMKTFEMSTDFSEKKVNLIKLAQKST